jgi:hypothetical protein
MDERKDEKHPHVLLELSVYVSMESITAGKAAGAEDPTNSDLLGRPAVGERHWPTREIFPPMLPMA